MKRFLPIPVLVLLVAGTVAQDVEPNLDRAARSLASELVRALPGRADEVQALVLDPAGAGSEVVGAVTAALLAEGFRVELGARASEDPGRLLLRLEDAQGDPHRLLVLETVEEDPWRFVRGYGDAAWVDAPGRGRLVVAGPFRSEPARALEAGRERAWRRLQRRMGLPAGEDGAGRSGDLPFRTFLASAATPGGGRVYRAFVGVDLEGEAVHRLLQRAERERRLRQVEPWLRGGASLLLGCLLLLGYLKADLWTRGYATARLRLAFGTLLVLGLIACWRLSP